LVSEGGTPYFIVLCEDEYTRWSQDRFLRLIMQGDMGDGFIPLEPESIDVAVMNELTLSHTEVANPMKDEVLINSIVEQRPTHKAPPRKTI
jgi:hypothetical protein